MKKLLTILAVVAALVSPGFGKTYKIPKEDAVCSIDFPSSWKVTVEDESVDASSEDDEIYINVEINDGDSIEGAVEETMGYLKKNKITIDKSSEAKQEGKFNGFDAYNVS